MLKFKNFHIVRQNRQQKKFKMSVNPWKSVEKGHINVFT